MAEVTPEIALRIVETLIGKQGTMFVLRRPSDADDDVMQPAIASRYTQADYNRIIKKHAPQLGGIKWDDLQRAGVLDAENTAIDFAKLSDLARPCPDFKARVDAAQNAAPSTDIYR